jgi:hypothetical protein
METKKRAPGRPKKNKDTSSQLRGIITAPDNEENRVELLFSYCAHFAKVIGIIKDYGASEVDFIFSQTSMTLAAADHRQKVDIYAVFPGAHAAAYYCAEETRVRISQKNLQTIFTSINKNHATCTIICRHEDYMSNLYVLLKENLHESITQLKIGVAEISSDASVMADTADYPLSFSLNSSSFKPLITSFRSARSLQLTKEKDYICLAPENRTAAGGVVSDTSFPINSSLNLQSTLGDEILAVSFEMDDIYRFASKLIGDTVYISVDHARKIAFSAETLPKDGKIQIKVFISLLTYNGTN